MDLSNLKQAAETIELSADALCDGLAAAQKELLFIR